MKIYEIIDIKKGPKTFNIYIFYELFDFAKNILQKEVVKYWYELISIKMFSFKI